MVGATVGLLLWTVYLSWRLPNKYVAAHWSLAWVGLDSMEVIALALTAWAAFRRRVILIFFAVATAMLFIVDAWFDVTTARRGDFTQSLLLALLIEVPASLALIAVAVAAQRRVIGSWFRAARDSDAPKITSVEFPSHADYAVPGEEPSPSDLDVRGDALET